MPLSIFTEISGTYHAAMYAREELLAVYPERIIRVLDTLTAFWGRA